MKSKSFCQAIYAQSSHSLTKLRMVKGPMGLGIYMCIIEALFDEPNAKLPREYDVIAYRFGISEEDVRQVVEEFELFKFTDDGMFYCELLSQQRQGKSQNSDKTKCPPPTQANNTESVCEIKEEKVTDIQSFHSLSPEDQFKLLRNDRHWFNKTLQTFEFEDDNELYDYIDLYEGACSENQIRHCDFTDMKHGFIIWLNSVFKQTS